MVDNPKEIQIHSEKRIQYHVKCMIQKVILRPLVFIVVLLTKKENVN